MLKLNRKEVLDQEFEDCYDVKLDLVPNKHEIKIELKDMYNRKVVFHFEQSLKLYLSYANDLADNLDHISRIKLIQESNEAKEFEIIFVFETYARITCKKFWYETEY